MYNDLPQTVNIRGEYGNATTMLYRKLKQHEKYFIEDNITYESMHGRYADKQIIEYENQAKQECKDLKKN